MKPKDVTDDSFVEYSEETNKKVTPNWSEEVFVVNKVQNTVLWSYLINDLNGEEIKGSFYEKELQKK